MLVRIEAKGQGELDEGTSGQGDTGTRGDVNISIKFSKSPLCLPNKKPTGVGGLLNVNLNQLTRSLIYDDGRR